MIFEWVIIKIVCFNWWIFWNNIINVFDVFELSVFVGLLVSKIVGLVINVCVMVMCCFWFLEILEGYLFKNFFKCNCIVNWCIFCFIFFCLVLVKINGIIIFFLFVIVGKRLKFWKIKFIICWWYSVLFLFFILFKCVLFIIMLFLVSLLKEVIKFSSVDFFDLDLFIIVINLLVLIDKFIWLSVVVVFKFLL